MEEEMEELYIEGLATHGGPESCVGGLRRRGEALTGVRAGRAIEPRNQRDRGADTVQEVEGHIAGGVIASCWRAPRGQRNQGMYGTFMRENWEIPLLARPVDHGWAVRGTPMAVRLG